MRATVLPLRDGEQIAPSDTVYVERTTVGALAVVTSHATPDCPGITAGASVTATVWAEARGDLFCPSQCLEVPGRDWAQLLGTSADRSTLLRGKQLDEQAQRAADRDAAKVTTRTRNDATDKQMAFIGTLLEDKGLGDQEPASVLFPSDNSARRRDGKLTRKEAGELIDLLMKLPDVANAPAAETEAADPAEVEAWLAGFGRKLEFSDIDGLEDGQLARFEAAACRWAAGQAGTDFGWLADVAGKAAAGQWAPRYLKGTLNCWRAAVRRGESAAASRASSTQGAVPDGPSRSTPLDLSGVPAGRYAVPGGGTRLKVRIDKPDEGRWAGWVFVKDAAEYGSGQRYGKQAPGGTYRGGIEAELRAIVADPYAAMVAYGRLTNRCGYCGRGLEDEESVARGIGPVCAAKF